MSKELVDKAYHNLHEVEANFSSMKTRLLEVRPISKERQQNERAFLYYNIKGCVVARLPKLTQSQQDLFNLFDLKMPQMTKSANDNM